MRIDTPERSPKKKNNHKNLFLSRNDYRFISTSKHTLQNIILQSKRFTKHSSFVRTHIFVGVYFHMRRHTSTTWNIIHNNFIRDRNEGIKRNKYILNLCRMWIQMKTKQIIIKKKKRNQKERKEELAMCRWLELGRHRSRFWCTCVCVIIMCYFVQINLLRNHTRPICHWSVPNERMHAYLEKWETPTYVYRRITVFLHRTGI